MMKWNIKLWQLRNMGGAIWQYLNQPLFEENKPIVWDVDYFWYLYRIQLLENCLHKDSTSESHYTQ